MSVFIQEIDQMHLLNIENCITNTWMLLILVFGKIGIQRQRVLKQFFTLGAMRSVICLYRLQI